MYCKNCGAELKENAVFCAKCGTKCTEDRIEGTIFEQVKSEDNTEQTRNRAPQTAYQEQVTYEHGQSNQPQAPKTFKSPMRLITKLVLVVALIAFIMPFYCVSCTYGDSYSITMTGFELMIGDDGESKSNPALEQFGSLFGEEEKDDTDTERQFNYFLIGAFVLGIISLVMLFGKGSGAFAGVLSLVAGGLVGLSKVLFVWFYKLDEIMGSMGSFSDYFEIVPQTGFYIALFAFIIAAILAFTVKEE